MFGPQYSRSSDFQDRMWDALSALAATAIGKPDAVNRLLDLGCGTGQRTRKAFRVFPRLDRVTAVDVDRSMIDEAIRGNRDARMLFKTLDIDDIGALAPASFDAITSNWALHWIRDKDRLFESLATISRPGSVMLIGSCERLPSILAHLDTEIRARLEPGTTLPLYYLDEREWRSLAARHGWRVLAVRTAIEHRSVPADGAYLHSWHAASTGKAFYGRSLDALGPEFLESLRQAIHARYAGSDGRQWLFTEEVLFLVLERAGN